MRVPRVPVAHVREGERVRIEGRVRLRGAPFRAPASGRACCFYRLVNASAGRYHKPYEREVTDGYGELQVDDDTGSVLIRMLRPEYVSVRLDRTYVKTIATREPSAEVEAALERLGRPVEGPWVRIHEGVLEDGARVAVVGRTTFEPTDDPSVAGRAEGFRAPPRRVVLEAAGGQPTMLIALREPPQQTLPEAAGTGPGAG
jgi:hypothetical protein